MRLQGAWDIGCDDELLAAFRAFASFGSGTPKSGTPRSAELDGKGFVKLCRDSHLVDARLTTTAIDLIFSRVRGQVDFPLFIASCCAHCTPPLYPCHDDSNDLHKNASRLPPHQHEPNHNCCYVVSLRMHGQVYDCRTFLHLMPYLPSSQACMPCTGYSAAWRPVPHDK